MQKERYTDILNQSGLFRYITPENYEKAADELDVYSMRFTNNQLIIRQNDVVEQIAIVYDGVVKAEKVHGIGSTDMVHTYIEGDFFGYEGVFSGPKTSPLDYFSDGMSKVVFFDIEKLNSSTFANELIRGLISCMADDSIRKMYRIEMISKKKLRDRIMTCLKVHALKKGTPNVTLNMSRQQLADVLCVNRSALSNELSEMQKAGLIQIDKRKITLL